MRGAVEKLLKDTFGTKFFHGDEVPRRNIGWVKKTSGLEAVLFNLETVEKYFGVK